MPKNVLTPYKLTRPQRRALADYFMHRKGADETANTLGITRQRLYTMITTIVRHMSRTKRIDIEQLLKDY